jgi:hypothetical protein
MHRSVCHQSQFNILHFHLFSTRAPPFYSIELFDFRNASIKLRQLVLSQTKFSSVIVASSCIEIYEHKCRIQSLEKIFKAESLAHQNFVVVIAKSPLFVFFCCSLNVKTV